MLEVPGTTKDDRNFNFLFTLSSSQAREQKKLIKAERIPSFNNCHRVFGDVEHVKN